MYCPNCNVELFCPCRNCKDGNKGKIKWKWTGGDYIKCPKCGFLAHCDHWQAKGWYYEKGKGF